MGIGSLLPRHKASFPRYRSSGRKIILLRGQITPFYPQWAYRCRIKDAHGGIRRKAVTPSNF
jgi:hypothetical protein